MHLSLLLATLVSSYSLCSRTDYQYKNQTTTSTFTNSATRQFQLQGQTINVQVSGTVEVVDGCSFKITNLVLSGGNYTASIFGGIIGSGQTAVRLTDGTITSSDKPQTQTFEFIQAAGSAVSYADFNQFRLFVIDAQAMIATADLPGKVTGNQSPSTGGTPAATRPTTPQASSVPTPTPTNGAVGYFVMPLMLVGGFVLALL